MSDKSLNKLKILDNYCKYDYLPHKVALALSFGVDPTEIDKFILGVEKVLSLVGNKTLLDKPIVISASIDELFDEINNKQKNLSFPQKLKELVNEYCDKIPQEEINLENKCAEHQLKIEELKTKIVDLEKQLKPLHGGERNGWVKLMAGIIAASYDHLLSKDDIKEWVSTIFDDLETAENNIDINVSQITLDKDTLHKKLTSVKTYCKKHPNK